MNPDESPIAPLVVENARLERRLQQVQAKLADAVSWSRELEAKLRAARRRNDVLTETARRLQTKLDEERAGNAALRTAHRSLEEDFRAERARSESLAGIVQRLRTELDQAQHENTVLTEAVRALRKKSRELNRVNEDWETLCAALRAEVARVKEENRNQKRRFNMLSDEYVRLRDQAAQIEAHRQQLLRERDRMSQEVRCLRATLDTKVRELSALRRGNRRYRAWGGYPAERVTAEWTGRSAVPYRRSYP